MSDEPKEIWVVFMDDNQTYITHAETSKAQADYVRDLDGYGTYPRRYVPDTVVKELVEALKKIANMRGTSSAHFEDGYEFAKELRKVAVDALLHTTSKMTESSNKDVTPPKTFPTDIG